MYNKRRSHIIIIIQPGSVGLIQKKEIKEEKTRHKTYFILKEVKHLENKVKCNEYFY